MTFAVCINMMVKISLIESISLSLHVMSFLPGGTLIIWDRMFGKSFLNESFKMS